MDKLHLKSALKDDYISLSKIFIKEYMPKASGEFLKIYLYVLCCLNDGIALSVSEIADTFDLTEKDVLRALKYWSNEGIISLENDGVNLTAITFLPIKEKDVAVEKEVVVVKELATTKEPKPEKPKTEPTQVTYSNAELAKIKSSHADFASIVHIVESHITKGPLSRADLDILAYIIDELNFNYDMMETLAQYCIDCGHTGMRYMQKVALGWYESGYDTVDKINKNCEAYRKVYGVVIKAFGIKDRKLNDEEQEWVKKWSVTDCFPDQFILEACHRTINQIGKADFRYTDKILSSWKENNVTRFEDIERLDKAHKARQTRKATEPVKKTVIKVNTFTNYEQGDCDYELMKINKSRENSGLEPITRAQLDELRAAAAQG